MEDVANNKNSISLQLKNKQTCMLQYKPAAVHRVALLPCAGIKNDNQDKAKYNEHNMCDSPNNTTARNKQKTIN